MEDTFRVRVDKAFGALGGDAPSSAGVTAALWCLTDEEVERREWNRNKEIPQEEVDAVVRTDLESDINESSEDEETEEINGRRNNGAGDPHMDEYLDVQYNIGRDCTLDYEEEEDEYDKVAVGTEQTDDRLSLRNVKYDDYVIEEFGEYRELPKSFETSAKDPRANHSAAMVRLREDAKTAEEFDALQLSTDPNLEPEDIEKGEVDVDDPKSSSDLTSEHIVGFDLSEYSAGVPDYLRNPSKYTRYAFDSSNEVDGESNRKAYTNFFHELRKRDTDTLMEGIPVEKPKSVMFTPKKKTENDSTGKSDSKLETRENRENMRWSVDIAVEGSQESELSAMEEDEPVVAVEGVRRSQKSGRRYRTKTKVDVNDNSD